MKRSKMQMHLANGICSHLKSEHINISYTVAEQLADYLLDQVEAAGMQPPKYRKTLSEDEIEEIGFSECIESYKPIFSEERDESQSVFASIIGFSKSVNEWEPEE